ncbi:MFS transporter [Pseudonocardia sp. MCCB 268]|nr:MFS transporter [Pseudonocardia cytotoxica]
MSDEVHRLALSQTGRSPRASVSIPGVAPRDRCPSARSACAPCSPRRPGYRLLWSARTVSECQDMFATVALALLVFDLTGSALGVGAVVLKPDPAGPAVRTAGRTLVDRLPRVQLMIAADVWRALLGGSLTVLGDHVVVVYVIAFRLGRGQSC